MKKSSNKMKKVPLLWLNVVYFFQGRNVGQGRGSCCNAETPCKFGEGDCETDRQAENGNFRKYLERLRIH